jgi:hypothetical protein
MIPQGMAVQHPAICTVIVMERQEKDTSRDAAVRILTLQEPDEKDAAFARRLGVGPQHVSNWKAGKGADIETAVRVHEATRASLHWLLTGEEPNDAYAGGFRAALDLVLASEQKIMRLLGSQRAAGEKAARAGQKVKGAARARRLPETGARGGRNP